MLGDINGIQGNTIHGVSVGGDADPTYHVGLDVGLSIGIGPNIEDRYELIQIPVNIHTSRWFDRTWLLAAETGVRIDLGSFNFDLMLKLGSMFGEDTGFTVVPTVKIGFLNDLFGIQLSGIAYCQDDSVVDGLTHARTSVGLHLNVMELALLFAGTKKLPELR